MYYTGKGDCPDTFRQKQSDNTFWRLKIIQIYSYHSNKSSTVWVINWIAIWWLAASTRIA